MKKTCKKCNTIKDIGDFYKLSSKSDKKRAICKSCSKKSHAEWVNRNKDYCKQYNKDYHARNKDRRIENTKKFLDKNPNYQSKWARENKSLLAYKRSLRRAAVLKATPKWANLDKIKRVYEIASELSRITGVPHEVDHIYPIKSDIMCGLHVENNLRVITRKENRSKGNKVIYE